MMVVMTFVRERRKQQPLRLTLSQISTTDSWQPRELASTSSHSTGIDTFSDLEKLDVLGHGNAGTVYKVRHRQSGSIYALKVQLLRENMASFRQQAFREAEILQRVDSQFVVKCYGVFISGSTEKADNVGDLGFAMEYMEGGSLHDVLLTRMWLPEQVISCIARSVLEGLHYLHNMNIVHGDIKPSNLLMNNKAQIKIADFGVSHIVEATVKKHGGPYMGTCAYMSPERIDPEKWNGCGSKGFAGDVWSLGLVVMECFMGHFPLVEPGEKPDWATLVWAICFGESLEMPKSASMEFQDFVSRCLERDWKMRGTVEELLDHPFVTNCQNCVIEDIV